MTRELITTAQDVTFVTACTKANIKPTGAQYSKFRRKFGLAYTTMKNLPVGSHVFEETGREFSTQKADGAAIHQEYGPFSRTPNKQPRKKK